MHPVTHGRKPTQDNEFCSRLAKFAVPLRHSKRDAQRAVNQVSWGPQNRDLEIKTIVRQVAFKAVSLGELV